MKLLKTLGLAGAATLVMFAAACGERRLQPPRRLPHRRFRRPRWRHPRPTRNWIRCGRR